MVECKLKNNKLSCICSYPCSRKGICCECLSYHRNRNELPACYFPKDIERTYDRTIENFIMVYKKKM